MSFLSAENLNNAQRCEIKVVIPTQANSVEPTYFLVINEKQWCSTVFCIKARDDNTMKAGDTKNKSPILKGDLTSNGQTTCKARDAPLSLANSYISNNTTSPSAPSQNVPDALTDCGFDSSLSQIRNFLHPVRFDHRVPIISSVCWTRSQNPRRSAPSRYLACRFAVRAAGLAVSPWSHNASTLLVSGHVRGSWTRGRRTIPSVADATAERSSWKELQTKRTGTHFTLLMTKERAVLLLFFYFYIFAGGKWGGVEG